MLAADGWLLMEPALLAVRLPAKLAALLPALLLGLLLVGSLKPAASRASAMAASATTHSATAEISGSGATEQQHDFRLCRFSKLHV